MKSLTGHQKGVVRSISIPADQNYKYPLLTSAGDDMTIKI